MGFLIAMGILALFSMALLHPYGRRVLAVMFGVCVVIGIVVGLAVVFLNQKPTDPYAGLGNEVASNAAAPAASAPQSGVADPGVADPWAANSNNSGAP